MNEFSEHGPVGDPALGDPAGKEDDESAADAPGEAGSDPGRGESEEHPQAETPPN